MREEFQIEIHLAHGCNLSCESCSHYSNYRFTGILSLETAKSWYRLWSRRVQPAMFSLLGGEPAINPELAEHVLLARKYWPHSLIRVVTNGFLLHRHPKLPGAMKQVGFSCLQVSKHFSSPDFNRKFLPVYKLLQSWREEHKIDIKIVDSYSNWTRRYIDDEDGNGGIRPYRDENERSSWESCGCRKCKELHEGKLWKCPIVAYLPMYKQKYGLSAEWDAALSYEPLDPSCSKEELRSFMAREEEPICRLCPAVELPFRKNDPLTVAKR